jgi:hypothetical protein
MVGIRILDLPRLVQVYVRSFDRLTVPSEVEPQAYYKSATYRFRTSVLRFVLIRQTASSYDKRYVTANKTFLSAKGRSLPAKDLQAGASGGNETYMKISLVTDSYFSLTHGMNFLTAMVMLCPPKPKELEMAVFSLASLF